MKSGKEPKSGRKKSRKETPKAPEPAPRWRFYSGYILLMMLLLIVWQETFSRLTVQTIPYSQFKQALERREVVSASVSREEITGKIEPKLVLTASTNALAATNTAASASAALEATNVASIAATNTSARGTNTAFAFRTVRIEDPALAKELQEAGIEFEGVRPGFLATFIFAWVLPIALMVFLWMFISRKMGSSGESVLGFGKSRAKLVADQDTGVAFSDVAGCDEAKYELQEVVDFLKNPDRYKSLGAKIPRGVLLVGPPGTGKTLLARAVAGEARVPFFSLSGSDFVEMFVGVGAARVRDLFLQAKNRAPCIVFIDELDAIGRQRGVHVGAVNDEREQTLNQLLVEMDGFEANAGVILLAATNRPDVLDRALLRPGRFDRQVIVDSPDIEGRLAILKVHARNKPLGEAVDLRRIAQATPGFSGADLANALNEAALLAARRSSRTIEQLDLEEAVEKVVAGPERKSRRLNDAQKRLVAYHEVGHALVAAYSSHADPVHKISIVPRGRAALGYTMQLPSDDQFLLSKSALLDRIRGILGGRAAEEIVFKEITTGAENDLERGTAMARQMVCVYGMTERLGLTHTAQRHGAMYLPGSESGFQRDCSEATAREIDEEVKRILDVSYAEAKEILQAHRDQLDSVSEELLKRETLDGPAFYQLIGKAVPAETTPAAEPPPHPAAEIVQDAAFTKAGKQP